MKIAILGYGVVGSGAYEVAQAAHNIEVKRVLYKRPIDELGDIVTTEYEESMELNSATQLLLAAASHGFSI